MKIPKPSGGFRALGIPTVKDRVVQMAVYLVLMPIFEADFHPRSFGFRPARQAHQTVEAIREALRMGKTEVVDAEQELRYRVRELTRQKRTWKKAAAVVPKVNQATRGWGNYFALGHYQRSFRQINHFVAHRFRQWLWSKHGNPSGKYQRWPDQKLTTAYGLYQMPSTYRDHRDV